MSIFDCALETKNFFEQKSLTVHFKPIVNSTNTWAKEALELEKSGLHSVYLASHQLNGRGRGANSWTDAGKGTALLSSWVIGLPAAPSPVTAARVGLSVITALSATFPRLNLSLKAPNDIFLNGKKLGGLLLENINQGNENALIVGIGLNIWHSPKEFPAISLTEATTDLSADTWKSFLKRLFFELQSCAELIASNDQLSNHECENINYFLNLNPNLSEKYSSVMKDGSLQLTSSTIHWTQL